MPVPVPFSVVSLAVVGLVVVAQHTPRWLMVLPPVAVMLPPLNALGPLMPVTPVVVMVAKVHGEVRL